MRRTGSIPFGLPSFGGAVRNLILLNVGVFFALAILSWASPALGHLLNFHLLLEPSAVIRGEVWQLFTYSLLNPGILSIVFGMLTLWFTGALLEGSYGSRWLLELYWTSVVGGAVIASVLSFTHLFGLRPDVVSVGAWAGIFGLLIAIAMLFGDQEFLLWFVLRIKAKYMVAIYILIEVAVLLKESDNFGALVQLSGALSGFLFVRFAPRKGLAFGFTERLYGVRNAYYRYKRRRAAKKFEVYMRKQNREVHFDEDGRYIPPEEAHRNPNDKRWMN
ncbi:rhomboid family intramembrane serine protease [Edaphobacter sp. 12200R-103]|jgi:membrane associated rhomboid family serine protease|uniref:rhomboid family intramembrane serine protease n=1 Tax=Edaphobacter sp. 12200R-103 TaxID=2703788 RepID=UPI00138B573F|nr:rhomboid family intramembrane serine protease [Edaphobacter sp. 12200R-103]QHS52439.1 rhomboid family intramembrane serine protease [Edaphobacter sp. 12200R-103]